MTNDDPYDPERLFRDAVADAEPLHDDRVEPFRRRLPATPRPVGQEHGEEAPVTLSEHEVVTGEVLSFMRPGVQLRLFAELKRGRIEPGLELDLHGLRVAEAQAELSAFLCECRRRRVRCGRIIHGKGFGSERRQPVLKQKINYWLRLAPEVLAFCSAPRHDGGTGAAYVLLKGAGRERR